MGPILPQINVFGKQLGISADVMGFVTSVLPILYVLAKPIFGFVIDYFPVSLLATFAFKYFPSEFIKSIKIQAN